jgi:WD40 repeat protein/energy-coupling factor transporter ATP-binding protein EcfA2
MGHPEGPVNPADGPVARFAVELRELRRRAGGPGYRELASLAHFSATTLAQAARGRALPTLEVTLAYVQACGGDVGEWEKRWHAVAAQIAPPPRQDSDSGGVLDDVAPYVGLAAYGPQDAEWFRGRDRLVTTLVDRVERQRFVAVVGASGSGKSSLLRAGLLPAVAADGQRWSTLLITPGAHPLQECAVRLGAQLGLPAGRLADEFAADPPNLGLAVRQLMATRAEGSELLLIVDQFEEVFTLCHNPEERDRFIAALLDAARHPDTRARVVVGLRADFYAHCARHVGLVEAMQDAQVLVGPMTTDELVQAVTEPAVHAGLMVEKTLVTTVVHEATERPGALPFLSHALWETWRRRHGNSLVLSGYRAAGGMSGAIAQSADRVYGDLDEQQRQVAQGILLRLTALGEGTEDTRRRVPRTELGDDPVTTEVVNRLAAARLITLAEDTVEIAHEALIRSWPMLRTWLAEDREAVLAHRQLSDAAAEWERHDRDDSLLYRTTRLAGWQDRPLDRLNENERLFLTAARHAAERERRVRRRRARLTIGGLSAATAVVTVLALVAAMMSTRANDERALAVSRQLMTNARVQLEVDPELALLLAREAYTRAPDDDTETLLRQAITDSHVRATIPARSDSRGPVAITGVAFTPDGQHLLSTDANGVLQVRDWAGGHLTRKAARELRIPANTPTDLVVSPDSGIAVATHAGVMTARNWQDDDRATILPGHDYEPCGLASSTDGRRMVSGDTDGTIRTWTTADNSPVQELRGLTGAVCRLALSANGHTLVSGGTDGTVRIWNLPDSGDPIVLAGDGNQIQAVAISPDSRHVAIASVDGTVRVWDPAGTAAPVFIGTHDGSANSVTYSADGHSIASTGSDGTVRIWNADYPRNQVFSAHHDATVVLRGHDADSAVFSPDGKSVVSAGWDGTIKVWNVAEVKNPVVLRGHQGPVWAAAPSPDGRQVASYGQDNTIRLWDTHGQPPVRTAARQLHTDAVTAGIQPRRASPCRCQHELQRVRVRLGPRPPRPTDAATPRFRGRPRLQSGRQAPRAGRGYGRHGVAVEPHRGRENPGRS